MTLSADFDSLSDGLELRTPGRTVTEADVVAFASLTGDRHPQHVDAQWAARGRFGERVAHGLLVLSYAAALVPFDPDRVVALRAVREAVFKHPVRLGDTIGVECRIDERRPLDAGHGLVTCALRVRNQHGRLCARVTLDLLWAREPAAAPASLPEPLLI
jgi:acyl dehydratase